MAAERPITITLVGVVILIWGALSLVFGVLALFGRDNGGSAVLGTSIIMIVVGVVYLAVAKGLFNGNSMSRLLVAVMTVISLIGGVWAFLTLSGQRVTGIVQAIVALLVLGLLYGRKANAFFD